MKHLKLFSLIISLVFGLTACNMHLNAQDTLDLLGKNIEDAVNIQFFDEKIFVDGKSAKRSKSNAVYVANDILYYKDNQDFTYGEGTLTESHSKSEAKAHKVVHITKPGKYAVSGELSKGQIAIDLGEGACENPEAIVTLVLNGVDITCDIAPAIVFYNVYECNKNNEKNASETVDTTKAGAKVIIADETINTVNGSYVAYIYDPASVVLNEDGTLIMQAEVLHDYEGAFYSKMSMNVSGEEDGTGVLNINAEKEGLVSECHLTIDSGNINIVSGDDGINTNKDGVSVTTINGGTIKIKVSTEIGEGDGVDSNGWVVINGGTLIASACSFTDDCGIDSYLDIHINGGTVLVTGNMIDKIKAGGQNYVIFNFKEKQDLKSQITLKNSDKELILEMIPDNEFYILIYSSPDLVEGCYSLWNGNNQLFGLAKSEFFENVPSSQEPSKDIIIKKSANIFDVLL